MMIVDQEIAATARRQVEQAMPREQFEHVVKKADPRLDLRAARSVQVEMELNVRLTGCADDVGAAVAHKSALVAEGTGRRTRLISRGPIVPARLRLRAPSMGRSLNPPVGARAGEG